VTGSAIPHGENIETTQTAAEITTRCPRFLKAGWFEDTQAFECGKGIHIFGDSIQRVEGKGESPGGRFIDRKCFLGMILAIRQVKISDSEDI